MKNWYLTLVVLVFAATVAVAQPPEEVPPPPPDTGVVDEPLPTAPTPPPAVRVAEPKALSAPPAIPESKNLQGVSVSPAIGIFPLGYDNVSITGEEGGRYYFSLKPGIGLQTSMNTSKKRTLDVTASYEFAWREYYNKPATTDRDFSNTFAGGFGMKWNEMISSTITGAFGHFFKNGGDESGDSGLEVITAPTLGITLNKQLSFSLAYEFYYLNAFNTPLSINSVNAFSEPVDDLDELRRGSIISDTTGFGNYPTDTELSEYIADSSLVLGSTVKPIDGTSLGLTYKFTFARLSNNDGNELSAHFITPKITQNLPWEGGSVTLANELRFRKFKFTSVDVGDGTTVPQQAFRNSIRFGAEQAITDSLTFSSSFRWDAVGSNKDNYAKFVDQYDIFMGVNYAF